MKTVDRILNAIDAAAAAATKPGKKAPEAAENIIDSTPHEGVRPELLFALSDEMLTAAATGAISDSLKAVRAFADKAPAAIKALTGLQRDWDDTHAALLPLGADRERLRWEAYCKGTGTMTREQVKECDAGKVLALRRKLANIGVEAAEVGLPTLALFRAAAAAFLTEKEIPERERHQSYGVKFRTTALHDAIRATLRMLDKLAHRPAEAFIITAPKSYLVFTKI